MILKNALTLSHQLIAQAVKKGDTVVDATCGNGHDTLFLSDIVGENGFVYAFDIQACAIESSQNLLAKHQAANNVRFICDGHEHMAHYIAEELSAVMFNFGYFPGGDHSIATQKDSSIAAIAEAMKLIKPGGLISLCVYSGGDTGFEEKDAILAFCSTINPKAFHVAKYEFMNQPNHPPLLVCIEKR